MKANTQCAIIWQYIKEHGSINPDEALAICGCHRLSEGIYDLKNKHGKDIARKDVYIKNKLGHKSQVAVYYLEG